MTDIIVVKGEGLTLDLLLWRKFGVRGRELVEETLRLNAGLSGLGPILPLGTSVVVPDLPAAGPTTAAVISLFE